MNASGDSIRYSLCGIAWRTPNHRLPGEAARQSTAQTTANDEPIGVLDLRGAAALALRGNPELAAVAVEIRARDGAVVQARARPNPTLGARVENVGGSAGARMAESTAELGQLLELGGKRSARVRLAERNRELAVELVTAQDRLILTADLVRLAEQAAATVAERVKAGKAAPIEETRAGATVASTRRHRPRGRHGARGRSLLGPGFLTPARPARKLRGHGLDRRPAPGTPPHAGRAACARARLRPAGLRRDRRDAVFGRGLSPPFGWPGT